MAATEKFYSLTEVAEIKNVRREAVYYAVTHGIIAGEKVGNTYMIPAAAVESYQPRPYRGKRGSDPALADTG